MSKLPPYLRVVPKPIAKAIPREYPKRIDGVSLRRNGQHWYLEHIRGGRVFEIRLTDWELRELQQQATQLLERNGHDVDE